MVNNKKTALKIQQTILISK